MNKWINILSWSFTAAFGVSLLLALTVPAASFSILGFGFLFTLCMTFWFVAGFYEDEIWKR